jgi:hypothetical protein
MMIHFPRKKDVFLFQLPVLSEHGIEEPESFKV